MDIFNRSPDEIVFDLIERDNPDLNPKLTPTNCYISAAAPNSESDAAQYNTIAYVVPRHNSNLSGRRAIKYNRIDLEDLFRGKSPVPVQGFSRNTAYATREEIASFLNQTYGLPIGPEHVDASGSSLQFYPAPHAEAGRGVFKIANNKCFIGQIYISFSRDFTQSLSSLFKPNFLAALKMTPNVENVKDHENWPMTYAFFADFDMTEIASNVNHESNITMAQATNIGKHVDKVFFQPAGQYNPKLDYDHTNPYGWIGAWNTHVACDTVAKLRATYPWLKTNYTHAKITKMAVDPSTGQAPDKDYFFALYFNWFVKPV